MERQTAEAMQYIDHQDAEEGEAAVCTMDMLVYTDADTVLAREV